MGCLKSGPHYIHCINVGVEVVDSRAFGGGEVGTMALLACALIHDKSNKVVYPLFLIICDWKKESGDRLLQCGEVRIQGLALDWHVRLELRRK